jgi:hypothetical protein
MRSDYESRDMVSTIKTQLPQHLLTLFEDMISPNLMSVLRENLLPLNERLRLNVNETQDAHFEKLTTTLFEHYNNLSKDIEWMKEKFNEPSLIYQQINAALSGTKLPRKLESAPRGSTGAAVQDDIPENRDTLQDM